MIKIFILRHENKTLIRSVFTLLLNLKLFKSLILGLLEINLKSWHKWKIRLYRTSYRPQYCFFLFNNNQIFLLFYVLAIFDVSYNILSFSLKYLGSKMHV